MKVYFAGAIRGDRGKKETFKRIVAFLKKQGHEVLTEHVAKDDILETERKKPDREIYAQDIGWLEQADVVIAEITKPSFGVGYEVAYASQRNKPVWLLYEKGSEKNVSAMALGNDHPKIKKVAYSTRKGLDAFLKTLKNPVNATRPVA